MNTIHDLEQQPFNQIATRIKASLPTKLKTVLNELVTIGCKPIFFGGFLRDLYLGVQPNDIDLLLLLPNKKDEQVQAYLNANCFNLNGLVYKNTTEGWDCDIVLHVTTHQNLFVDQKNISILLENIRQTLDFNLNALFFDYTELFLQKNAVSLSININLSFDRITTLKNAAESFNESPERCLINLPKLIAKFPNINLHPDILQALAHLDKSAVSAGNMNFWRKLYQAISSGYSNLFIKILFDGWPLNDSKKFIPANYLLFGMEYPATVQQAIKEFLLEFSKYLSTQKNKNSKNLYIIFNVLLLIGPYIAEKKQIESFGGFDLAVIRNKLVFSQNEMLPYSNSWLQQVEALLENYFRFFDDNSKTIEDELLLLLVAIVPFDFVKAISASITAKSLLEKKLIKQGSLTSVNINAPLLSAISQLTSPLQVHDKKKSTVVDAACEQRASRVCDKTKQNDATKKTVTRCLQLSKKRSQKINYSTLTGPAEQIVASVVIATIATDKVEFEKLKQQQDEIERYQRSQEKIAAANSISAATACPEPVAQTVKPSIQKRKNKTQTDNLIKKSEIKFSFFKEKLQNAAIFAGCLFALTAVFIRASLPRHDDPGLKEYKQISSITLSAFLLCLFYEVILKTRIEKLSLTNNYLVKTLFLSKQDNITISIENSATPPSIKNSNF